MWKSCSEGCKTLNFFKSAAEVFIKLYNTELPLCCWCYSYFIPRYNMIVININRTEKVIKFVTYCIIFFGTYCRTAATKNWNLFNSCVCLNETSREFPEGKFPPTVFFGDHQSPEKMQQEGTQRKRAHREQKLEWNSVSKRWRKTTLVRTDFFFFQWQTFCFLPQLL